MKKIIYIFSLIILLVSINSCGYTPIFGNNINLKINNHSLDGDDVINQKIYSSIKNLLLNSEENSKKIDLYISSSKNKLTTSTSASGEAIEYKIVLLTKIEIKDPMSGVILFEYSNELSQSYKVQDQIFATENMENKTTNNLADRMSQDLLAKISQIKI